MNAVEFTNVSRHFRLMREKRNSFQERIVNLFKPSSPVSEFWALKDVSFEVPRGTTLGLIGHNGSGKSTTLKLVTRILEPTLGRVAVQGRVSALLELGSGFHPDLSGRDNIYLNGSLLGFNRADMNRRIDDIIEFAELGQFIDTPVKHYSSGMYMRLGFAIATAVEPDILITDEVLAVGDENFQRKCMDRIHEFRREGRTILFVSHSLESVRNLCSKAIWLNEGQVQASGDTTSTIDAYLRWANAKDRDRREHERAERELAASETASSVHVVEIPTVQSQPDALATAAEAESAPKSLSAETAVGLGRFGSGEIEIDRVEFLDRHGEPREVFTTGETLIVRLHYHANETVVEPIFGLAIFSVGGLHINGPNTRFGGQPIPEISGRGYVDYIVDELPLLAGTYVISAAVYDNTLMHPYDHHDRQFMLHVQTGSVNELFGTVLIPSRWVWHQDPGTTARLNGRSAATVSTQEQESTSLQANG